MALFVQIDHFRKTDQKPTVKNHLFSISWFRSFNRTSFQQQLKLNYFFIGIVAIVASIVHPFNNNWNSWGLISFRAVDKLQSYILSTTTETIHGRDADSQPSGFNRTSFQQQLKHYGVERVSIAEELQSYILSTTTETGRSLGALYI